MRYSVFLASLLCLLGLTGLGALAVYEIEYFFDSDPGPGNGFEVLHRDTVSIAYNINTSGLEPGIHRLYVRACNEHGIWGLPRVAQFIVANPSQTVDPPAITEIEYYFDTDPGQGEGVQIYSRNPVELDQLIDVTALSPGIHRLYIRGKNSLGDWGMPRGSAFYISYPEELSEPRTISGVEYYFDSDPGPGNGYEILTRDLISIDPALATTGLVSGVHRLYVRGQNDLGIWGMPRETSFLILYEDEPGAVLSGLEYFIDTDPGFGNGSWVALSPEHSASLTFPITVGAVEPGNHFLYFRGRDSNGSWGLPVACQFSNGIPAHLVISVSNGVLSLGWDDLYGIDSYRVYSSDLTAGPYAEDDSGSYGLNSWSAPAPPLKRFYRVTSIYTERQSTVP